MSINTSAGGLQFIKNLANGALERSSGIEIAATDRTHALKLRQSFNAMRFKDRQLSTKIYEKDSKKYGTSDYDGLETRIEERGGQWYFSLRPILSTLKDLEIRDLETGEVIKPEDL